MRADDAPGVARCHRLEVLSAWFTKALGVVQRSVSGAGQFALRFVYGFRKDGLWFSIAVQ